VLEASKVLVVDDSSCFRQMIATILAPHCAGVLQAKGYEDGLRRLGEHRDLSLILCDVAMPDGNGFQLLEQLTAQPEPHPQLILVTAHPRSDDERRAIAMGAAGYLSKPTSYLDICRVLRQQTPRWRADRRRRRRLLGRAHVTDPDHSEFSHLAFDMRDVGAGGAFLETSGPIPVGTRLNLSLVLGPVLTHVKARVVRVQEPAWGRIGGVGVSFEEMSDSVVELLENYVEKAHELQ